MEYNYKVDYEKDIIPYIKKGIIVSFSKEELNKIDKFAREKTQYKVTEEFYKDESFMYQCNYNGQLGELAVERVIKIPFVDWTVGPLRNYAVCDIPQLQLGIKTCKLNHLPLVPIHNKYPQIICIILPDNKVSIVGVAKEDVLNKYQTEDTLSDLIKNQKRKRAFYGFDKIIPLRDYFT